MIHDKLDERTRTWRFLLIGAAMMPCFKTLGKNEFVVISVICDFAELRVLLVFSCCGGA